MVLPCHIPVTVKFARSLGYTFVTSYTQISEYG